MKTRYRVGREGLFGKQVLILQIWVKWKEGPPDSYGGAGYPAGEGWRDATVKDITELEQSK